MQKKETCLSKGLVAARHGIRSISILCPMIRIWKCPHSETSTFRFSVIAHIVFSPTPLGYVVLHDTLSDVIATCIMSQRFVPHYNSTWLHSTISNCDKCVVLKLTGIRNRQGRARAPPKSRCWKSTTRVCRMPEAPIRIINASKPCQRQCAKSDCPVDVCANMKDISS